MNRKEKARTAAVIYIRVSTDEQRRNNNSLEYQEKACREFCRKKGWTVAEVFADEGVSAWLDVKRPAFLRMMKYVRETRNVNVVFLDFSRFGRKTLKGLNALEDLDKWGALYFAALRPDIDCTTAAGRKALRDELSDAENFSDLNSEKTRARMKARFDEGWYCRQAPIGYRNTGVRDRDEPNIVPDEAAPSVVKAFYLMATGNYTAAEVLRILNNEGFTTKKGNPVAMQTFAELLRNPVYIGLQRSKTYDETAKGRWRPIVDDETFYAVQMIITGKKPTTTPHARRRPDFPLRITLFCEGCGKPLTGGKAKGRNGKQFAYYWCRTKGCRKVKSLKVGDIDAQFV